MFSLCYVSNQLRGSFFELVDPIIQRFTAFARLHKSGITQLATKLNKEDYFALNVDDHGIHPVQHLRGPHPPTLILKTGGSRLYL